MRAFVAAVLLGASAIASALEVAPAPYQARATREGTVRVWGNPELRPLLERWVEGVRRSHPQVRIETHLAGSDVAMAGLYTAKADVALLGRAATAPEVKAFEWIYRYPPLDIEIATGSLAQPGRSPAVIAYVHRDNPLAGLTLRELDAIFSRERRRGAGAPIATWGGLGLAGEWASRPIRLYLVDSESGTGRFFRAAALKDSRMLHWDRITEFSDTSRLRDPSHDAAARALQALARDPFGLAVASGEPVSGAKALALCAEDGACYHASAETLVSRRYPLARSVHAYVNRKPGTPLDAPTRAFLDYVLGADGQRDIDAAAAYLRLAAEVVREERAKLDQ